jgi:hypothetical protein
MFKTAIVIAIFSSGPAFAATAVLAPSTQLQQQSQEATVVSTQGAAGFDHLSMGPDPGGKTGDTVTPTTTNTSQPSTTGTGASSQSGAGSQSGAASTTTDPTTRPTTGSETSKH